MTRGTPEPTARLSFREYAPEDLEFVAELFSDLQARTFYPTMGDEENQRSWIDWNLASYEDHGFGLWVAQRRDNGAMIGDCGLTMQDVQGKKVVEVGYHLREDCRREGFATEMAQACVRYALNTLGVDSVCSIVDPDNEPSIRVATRIHKKQQPSFQSSDGKAMLLFTSFAVE